MSGYRGAVSLAVLILTLHACGHDSELQTGKSTETSVLLADLFEGSREVTLEEPPGVITVAPVVQLTAVGDLLVADSRENQIRIYGPDGRLRRFFGRMGDGPGEFRSLQAATMLDDLRIIAMELNGRTSVFDSLGQHQETTLTALDPVQAIQILDSSQVLVTGPLRGHRLDQQLHVIDVFTGDIEYGFFTPRLPDDIDPAFVQLVAWSSAAVRADTVAAAFSVSDSLQLFTADGRFVRAVHIRLPGYRPIVSPREDLAGDPLAPIRWFGSFDLVSRVHWTSHGDLLVQLQTMDVEGHFKYQLVRMTRTGELVGHVANSPRLLLGQSDPDVFFFLHPQSETPDRWLAMSYR